MIARFFDKNRLILCMCTVRLGDKIAVPLDAQYVQFAEEITGIGSVRLPKVGVQNGKQSSSL
jgi:hypothetical protein